MYDEKMLVKIAKRENNNKRNYLVVNRLQGKHIKVSPKIAFDMFDALADKLKNEYLGQKILVVGFAETATAIGARIAIDLGYDYIQTTREIVENVEYLYFTEAHSHATEQKLVKNDIDALINEIDRILFVEDEVTTGNTILDIINIIDKKYDKKINYSVASLLNGMDKVSLKVYEEKNIIVHYLVKTNHSEYSEIADTYNSEGKYIEANIQDTEGMYSEFDVIGGINSRRKVNSKDYVNACESLFNQINQKIEFNKDESVLVIGTEETMYPAIYVGYRLEENGMKVLTHSTTRSPIATDNGENYPVHVRYELSSLYESDRRTFIYDLDKYDKVLIVTDAIKENDKALDNYGINSLINALKDNGNENIYVARWSCN